MSHPGRVSAIGLLLALGLGSCAPEELPPLDMVARVGDESIRTEDLERYFRRQVGDGAAGLDSIVLSRLLDRRIEEELLWLLAVEEGWIDGKAGREEALSSVAERAADLEVSDAAVERVYREHPERYLRPERARLRHLMTGERRAAEMARDRILSGESFGVVARELSEAPTAEGGGAQGLLDLDDLANPFREVVEALEVGEVSPVIATAHGFHLFLLESREGPGTIPLETAAGSIRERLQAERAQDFQRSLVEKAAARYDVVVYRRNLPFQYQGRFP